MPVEEPGTPPWWHALTETGSLLREAERPNSGRHTQDDWAAMSAYLMIVLAGLLLTFAGFSMAFRQRRVRSLLGRPAPPRAHEEDEDPLAYGLRIAGVMIMAFGVIIVIMFGMVHILS